jgi:hypothetical protein
MKFYVSEQLSYLIWSGQISIKVGANQKAGLQIGSGLASLYIFWRQDSKFYLIFGGKIYL